MLAGEQQAFLREVYDGIENFRDALGFLFTGFFRGFAHVEKHLGENGEILRLEPVEQWFWVRDGMFGDWEYNENAVSGRFRGIPIERENFVIFESAALNRLLAPFYVARGMNMKDWAGYLEVFGIPSAFLIEPPSATAEKDRLGPVAAKKCAPPFWGRTTKQRPRRIVSTLRRRDPLTHLRLRLPFRRTQAAS